MSTSNETPPGQTAGLANAVPGGNYRDLAEKRAISRIYDAQLAAKIDDIVARAEQNISYAISDHRFMSGLRRAEKPKPARRVTIKAGSGSLTVVLTFEAEIKLWAYARRLERDVSDVPFGEKESGR